MVMRKTKVKKDSHSLYVRTNGNVYRPVKTRWSYAHSLAIDPSDPYGSGTHLVTQLSEGDEVRVGALSQSPYCRVVAGEGEKNKEGREEHWHSHGMYYDEEKAALVSSERCWEPL